MDGNSDLEECELIREDLKVLPIIGGVHLQLELWVVSQDQQGFHFRVFALRVEGLGNSFTGEPIKVRSAATADLCCRHPIGGGRDNRGGECTWEKGHALHSLQLKGGPPEGLRKISAFPNDGFTFPGTE